MFDNFFNEMEIRSQLEEHPHQMKRHRRSFAGFARDSLSALYDRFPFVDQRKRELILIQESAVGFAPQLRGNCELQERDSGICSLLFRKNSRSVLVYFKGKEQDPEVICHWDECALFSFRAADHSVLAPVLKGWLCDGVMPSAMRNEF